MQVRDVGAAAAGGLVVAGALTVPGLVRRVRDIVAKVREDEAERTKAVANLIAEVERHEKSLDVVHEDLDILIGVVAGAVLDLDAPASKPLADLVVSRPGPRQTIAKIEVIFAEQRVIAAAKREEKRRAEEEEAGTTLRCPECDELRPDYAEWDSGTKKDQAPMCPSCGSDKAPEAREHG